RNPIAQSGSRLAAPHGAGISVVSGAIEPVGQQRRGGPATRLPGLVRPGDGRVQRVGERIISRRTAESNYRRGRSQLALWFMRNPPPAVVATMRRPSDR